LHRRASELLDAVHRGSERPPEPLPQEGRPPPPAPEDGPLIALSEAFVRARAREAGLAYELLAARADLQAIVAARRVGGVGGIEANVRTLRGWRRELVGSDLLELLDGRVSLSVSDREIRVTSS
jgi:ribonuclease D